MNRTELKSKIPHGYGKIIAKKAGVTDRSVSMFLHGKINSHRIEMTILEVLSDIGKNKSAFIADII